MPRVGAKHVSFTRWKSGSVCLALCYIVVGFSVFVYFMRIVRRFRKKDLMLTLWFCVIISLSAIYVVLMLNTEVKIYPDRYVSFQKIQQRLKESVLEENDQGCHLPDLDPFAPELSSFDVPRSKIVCDGKDWVECYKSECYVTKEILDELRDVVCIYKDILYIHDHDYRIGDPVKVYGDKKYILNNSDHVKISCTGIEKNGLGLIPRRWYGHGAGLRPIKPKQVPGRQNSLNVLILCFDSTSHNGFRRRMPLSYKVLQEEMGATILNGYNIIGDGTPAAIFPLLSGKTELEHPEARILFANSRDVDPDPFIFNILKRDGYRTAYFEDMPWVGTFQYRYNGFKSQPADHYLRAFLLEESQYGVKWWKGIKSRHCIGSLPQYGVLLNLTKQFTEVPGKHFSFTFISDISHNDFLMISTSDDDVVDFLRYLKDTGKLEDHLIILMGCHGSRYFLFRETYQGKMEERLPLMAIILPERLKRERPEAATALRYNVNVLTTPFDIHTTIVDAIGRKDLANKYYVPESPLPRGMSLLEAVPKSRTCGQAAILPHWCVCYKWQNVPKTNPLYKASALALTRFINNMTEEKRSLCEERELLSIQWVMKRTANDDVLQFGSGVDREGLHEQFLKADSKAQANEEDYQVKIIMTPGRAIYEATMKYILNEDRFVISDGDVSRITEYGEEPSCVSHTHPHLNKFCYCKISVNKTIYTAKNSSTTSSTS